MRYFLLLILTVLAAMPADPPRPQSKAAAPATKRNEPNVSDVDLERKIREKFAKSKAGSGLQVKVRNGIATIEGPVALVQHKGAATRMARTAGARAVVNNAKVSEPGRQTASQQLAKTRRTEVKRVTKQKNRDRE